MTALERARSAIESLKDANPYDPGDVDTALDSVAWTLSRALLRQGKLRWLLGNPSLEDVLTQLGDQFEVEMAEQSLDEIRKILDENAYPDDQEIEEADEMKEHLQNLAEALSSFVNAEEKVNEGT